MRVWTRNLLAAAGPLLLAGCLWTPGKFTSDLALRNGGTFVLDYRGEIVLQKSDEKKPPIKWSNAMAVCNRDGRTETVVGGSPSVSTTVGAEEVRPCTAKEIAELKSSHEKQIGEQTQKQRDESEQMAKMFGLPGADDESNRRFAAKLMKYQGCRSVAYRGNGVSNVDYHFEGRVDQDFAFPMMPDSDMVLPFVVIRRRTDGSVQVTAPAFTGAAGPFGARAMAMGIPKPTDQGPVSKAQGRFTITTDGEILTNNSEDGPAAASGGRQIRWDVSQGTTKIPEMLVRLR